MDNKKEERNQFSDEETTPQTDSERGGGMKKRDNSMSVRDIISEEHMNPAKLSSISVYSNRGDTMTQDDEAKFEQCMNEFCKNLVAGEPTTEQFTAFYVSLVQCWLNQSTSMKNMRQRNLQNTFKINDQKFTWRTMDFMNYVKGNLPHISNPFRQYARSHEKEIEILKSTGKVVCDHHLQAKHGVVSQYWNLPADYVNGSLINISDDDLAANLLMRCQALKRNKVEKKIYNVSQLAPGGCSE
ncbi:capsid protein [Tetterwort vein chlorosis virus]|uniref:Capsid protein n=1 Tax=Tetterwort vein chlorosis virus TaxID=1712389 RepID=A0A0M4MAW8_9CLOS|nr:capsid protein [Tetterwort vein chlorosis virus]ALE18223.1 capsid protein [Tetterwort vein chlorosis virus]